MRGRMCTREKGERGRRKEGVIKRGERWGGKGREEMGSGDERGERKGGDNIN